MKVRVCKKYIKYSLTFIKSVISFTITSIDSKIIDQNYLNLNKAVFDKSEITKTTPKSILRPLLKASSSASLISRYILRLGQRGHCCFCAACSNRKMYLEIRGADEGLFKYIFQSLNFLGFKNKNPTFPQTNPERGRNSIPYKVQKGTFNV